MRWHGVGMQVIFVVPDRWQRWGLRLLPKRTLTVLIGYFSRLGVSRYLIPYYIRWYQIDPHEAEYPISTYRSLGEFFARGLRKGARPVADEGLISPVDGTVSQTGKIERGTLVQAKGSLYDVSTLLGSQAEAASLEGGVFITLYLSPRDYHRIHMPLSGRIVAWRYIPGCLYPVNARGVRYISGLYSRNERLVTWLETEYGRMAVVKVGAAIVGSIRTSYGPAPVPAWRRERRRPRQGVVSLWLEKGEEMGRFEFGSTVILLCPPGLVDRVLVADGEKVRMGEQIAVLKQA
ncbi:archaetidylserine decarboxylase [Alicyclobacillus herbarius]|uniref:archaetidylserine decarboxylase n=1 Tax=Alicyclobacillus herbarius TaxID=122960 RepID=UPI000415666F|nr:archaetidylserine decarboxylase [Alicyclobacillus herbarius]